MGSFKAARPACGWSVWLSGKIDLINLGVIDGNADGYDAEQPPFTAVVQEAVYLSDALLRITPNSHVPIFHPGNPGSIPGEITTK